MATPQGWIKLHRQITENEFYFSERFTRAQAWIDLLLLAAHKERTVFIRGVEVNLKPGELCYSQLSLAKRWRWNRKTVMAFLKFLAKREMVLIRTDKRFSHLTTVIAVRNWAEYQGNGQLSGQQNGQRKDNRTDTNKNGENVENVEKEEGYSPEPTPSGPGLKTKSHTDSEAVVEAAKDKWNDFAQQIKLVTVMKITDRRRRGVLARLKEKEFNLDAIFAEIRRSPFLQGKNQRGWKVDFDWIFLHTGNYLKVLEGKYKNQGGSENGTTGRSIGSTSSQYARATFHHDEAARKRLRDLEATLAERDRERSERA
jgi:hypothetical protein